MEKGIYQHNNVIYLNKKQGQQVKTSQSIEKKDIVFQICWILASFFISRVVILDELAPFGVALYASFLFSKFHSLGFLLSISIGILSVNFGIEGMKYIIALVMIYIYGQAIKKRCERLDKTKKSLVALISLFIADLIYLYFRGFVLYNFIIDISEGIIAFIMVYIFSYIIDILSVNKRRRILSNEEMICISVFISLVIVGFWDAKLFFLSFRNVLSVYIILISAYVGGAGVGASIGITVGFVLSLAGMSDTVFIGCLGICGLMAGTFKDLGRITTGVAFVIANALITFYINRSTYTIMPIEDIIGGGILLVITPTYMLDYITQFFDASVVRHKEQVLYVRRMQDIISNRLKEFSMVFNQLSKTFSDIAGDNDYETISSDVNNIINSIADAVCFDCSLYKSCWEKGFYITYNSLFKLLTAIDKKGELAESDILSNRCYKPHAIIEKANEIYSIYRDNLKWERQLDECRYLVADQLLGISHVIDEVAAEIDIDIHFKRGMEEQIKIELDKRGVRCKDVLVLEKATGKVEVSIVKKACRGRRECNKVVEGVVSQMFNKTFACKNRECIYAGGDECSIYLEEAKKINIITGIACKAKGHNSVMGDSHSFMELKGGKFMLALSDGMGSGSRAALESQDVICLLENFMEAGFELDVTVKTINSVLILRSEDEIFATADICIIDQITGYAEFIKIGAVSTFIKRGNTIDIINGSSLPIGIIENIELDRKTVKLQDGDMIIMITDGILDSYNGELDKDRWLSSVIAMNHTKNPQELADYIMDCALEMGRGEVKDDMTVMVSRVWRSL